MDFNRQTNQNQAGQPAQAGQSRPLAATRADKRRFSVPGGNFTGGMLLVIAAILVAFGLLWLFGVKGANEAGQINQDEYQAVFLTSGQVYFGKLKKLNPTYAKLTDIYYLQAKQSVQPKQSGSQQSQSKGVQLVKLGNELHGPEDAMQINRKQMLFWENLKPSGKVTKAIMTYQKNGGNTSNTTNTNTAPTSNSQSGSPAQPSGSNSQTNSNSTPNSNNTNSSNTSGNNTGGSNTSAGTNGTTKP
jgi:hypothetical protein